MIATTHWHSKGKKCICKLKEWPYGQSCDGYSGMGVHDFQQGLRCLVAKMIHLAWNWQPTSLACEVSQ